jgi:hypothetical protein
MWCDNCLLLLPLRAGAIAWGVVIVLYSVVGSIFLFKYGMFLYFLYPEWQIYGGIGMGVAATALVNIVALSNRNYLFVRVCKFLWPFIIVIAAVRAILMIWELNRGQDKIAWECANGGQQYGLTPLELELSPPTMPIGLCTSSFHSIWTAFIISLLVDLAFQMYMFFLNWRYSKRLEHYGRMNGPMAGGYYKPY